MPIGEKQDANADRRTPLRGAWIEIITIENIPYFVGRSHPAQGCVD